MSLSPSLDNARPLKPLWFNPPLKHVVFKMHHLPRPPPGTLDPTASLSDELLLGILSRVPDSDSNPAYSLVCRRWLSLHGRLRRRISLLHWPFLSSGRLALRFPSLEDADLVPACFAPPEPVPIVLSRRSLSVPLHPSLAASAASGSVLDPLVLPRDAIDGGLRALAGGCPNLRRLALVAASGPGLASVADSCATLQELELHRCDDPSLKAVAGFQNLQILKLVGSVDGLYGGRPTNGRDEEATSGLSDIGLTIVAHGCKRLVKLELSGCEGSYDGIGAIGKCCPMLEELTICDHRMDAGWVAALSFCGNLKTLRLQGCKRIDADPGPLEHLGVCPTIERLVLQRCQLRDRQSLHAFSWCAVRLGRLCFRIAGDWMMKHLGSRRFAGTGNERQKLGNLLRVRGFNKMV
ncbi:F-box protein [Acorus calamus]|uniref:F-box protein n=1 Tax=Acorus calamus TaxID=4465 RepID=A0AAV9DTK6_ACOCL|nr:F-box protein [Acorus calamus]